MLQKLACHKITGTKCYWVIRCDVLILNYLTSLKKKIKKKKALMKLTFIKSPEYDIKRSKINQFISVLDTKLKGFSRRDSFEWSIITIKQQQKSF